MKKRDKKADLEEVALKVAGRAMVALFELKRPFGMSDGGFGEIAEILGMTGDDRESDPDYPEFTQEQFDYVDSLIAELPKFTEHQLFRLKGLDK